VVKVEGMVQEEAAVVVVAVRGGAGNDLPQFSFSMIFPSQRHPFPIQLPDHRPIAWVPKLGIDIVSHKIEKGRELGKADPFGVGFVSLGEAIQTCKDLFRGYLVDWSITEFPDISIDDGPVGSRRIFF